LLWPPAQAAQLVRASNRTTERQGENEFMRDVHVA